VTQSENPHPDSFLARVWPWSAAAGSGVLLTLCFAPWNQGWLCWIALTPLAAAVFAGGGAWRRLALGYLSGLVFFTTTFWWLGSLAQLYENSWLRGIPILLSLYLALFPAFWAWFIGTMLAGRSSQKPFESSLRNLALGALGASAWVAGEWVRERLFGGFGWNPLGVALHHDLAMIQIAELTGTPGLSWLIAFSNLMAVIIVRRIVGELGIGFSKRIRWEFSATMVLIAVVFAFGVRRLLHPEPVKTVPLHAIAVQPNIPEDVKRDSDAEERMLEKLQQLTELALRSQPAPQLVIWPESAVPPDKSSFDLVMALARQGDFSFLLGMVEGDPIREEEYNAALLLTNQGASHQSYRKIHLVPFGEYLPLRPVLGRFLSELVPGDFTPGREYTVMHMPKPSADLAVLICFEDTLGDLTRHFVQNGAQVLVNITNDGWFDRTPAAEQHLANAVLRAVENRRPLVRCGNTGVTCQVYPTGRIEQTLAPFHEGFATTDIAVPTAAGLTFYTQHGDWLSEIAIAVTVLGIGLATVRKKRSSAAA
jgi:apolipoprotein N-acyltransferase